jgi:transposase
MKQSGVVYIGIDVSKDTLDIDAGDYGVSKIRNAPAEIRRALAALARKAGPGSTPHVCFESGSYTDALVAACRAQPLPHSVLNPYRVSCFSKALAGAKTDRIDAGIIRRFAAEKAPRPAPPPSKAAAGLDKLLAARGTLRKATAACQNALGTLGKCPGAAGLIAKAVAQNRALTARLDRLIAEAVAADGELAGLTAALETVKGVGPLTAATLAAWMPELGALGRRGAAKLAGLAPYTRQSGKWKGHTWTGGGRKHVRDALFMPATVARMHDPHLRRVYDGLRARGKPYMVAMTAVMRKLIVRLDAAARAYRAGRGDAKA